ncbi:hypothetical protein ACIOHC_36420 [Streptomyces sp. NPDC088252]|uniref:hypothetical protein n=1 Tax=Streptomyces sp. NPDC088252 TaxID=3365845 RepID=UPI00381714F6
MSGSDERSESEKEATRQRNIRRIAEAWAEHESLTLELEELNRLPAPAPAQLRRIAELVESLQDKGASLSYWEAAAAAGDRDAQDYLTEWNANLSDTDSVVAACLLVHRDGSDPREGLRRLAEDHDSYLSDVEKIRDMDPDDFKDGGG